MATTATKRRDSDVEMTDVKDLYNPWEGKEDAWQLGETISDFTKRLPVLDSSHIGPWIWIANPYADRNCNSEPEQHDASFVQLAVRILKEFTSKKDALTSMHPEMAPGTVSRTLKPHRDQLKDDVLKLAKERKMTCGKVGVQTKCRIAALSQDLRMLKANSGCCSRKSRMLLDTGPKSPKPPQTIGWELARRSLQV
jgi:hypothetical protein